MRAVLRVSREWLRRLGSRQLEQRLLARIFLDAGDSTEVELRDRRQLLDVATATLQVRVASARADRACAGRP